MVTKIFGVNFYKGKFLDPVEAMTPLTDQPPTHDLFLMISSMINLEALWLSHTMVSAIPSHAFRSVNGIQEKLTNLSFDKNIITKVGSSAFSELPNLKSLYFNWNPFETIQSNAFEFRKDSNETLTISFHYTKLDGAGFETGTFNDLKRPTVLLFGLMDNLKYLEKKVFQPFFETNIHNKIAFESSEHIDCDDCRSYWLQKEQKYIDRTDLKKCSNGKNFTDNTNFPRCTEF
jgi:hypothetical protein